MPVRGDTPSGIVIQQMVSALLLSVLLQANVAEIEALSARLDALARTAKPRLFADVAKYDQKPRWKEFATQKALEKARTGENLFSTFSVWRDKSGSLLVVGNFSSRSGDWAEETAYIFRPAGSLAKLDSALNTFIGNVSISRVRWFDASARAIKSRSAVVDLDTRKPKKSSPEFAGWKPTVYLKLDQLPIQAFLKK